MNEIVKGLPLRLEITSPEAMLVALVGIAAFVYLTDKAIQNGYEIQFSENTGLSIHHLSQHDNKDLAESQFKLKADEILNELSNEEGANEDSQELQVL